MTSDIPESDWRCFKEVHTKAEERYCRRILEEVAAIVNEDAEGSGHDRYFKVCKLIKEHNKQMVNAFDDFRRSTAVMQLGIMRRMKLLTDEELMLFSEPTRTRIEGVASL
jgi:hypothetical protein